MSGSADKALALQQAREAMIAKRFGGNTNGAKVSDGVRRKKQVTHVSQQGTLVSLFSLLSML